MKRDLIWLDRVPQSKTHHYYYEGKLCTVLGVGYRHGEGNVRCVEVMDWRGVKHKHWRRDGDFEGLRCAPKEFSEIMDVFR